MSARNVLYSTLMKLWYATLAYSPCAAHIRALTSPPQQVHSSFKPVPGADYVIPVEIDGITHRVYVCKRPGCDEFLESVGRWFEVVVFTASLSKYAG